MAQFAQIEVTDFVVASLPAYYGSTRLKCVPLIGLDKGPIRVQTMGGGIDWRA